MSIFIHIDKVEKHVFEFRLGKMDAQSQIEASVLILDMIVAEMSQSTVGAYDV